MNLSAIVCAVLGHQWAVIPAGPALRGGTYGPYRVCARMCSNKALVLAVEPPAGHPDSMIRKLTPEQEAQLAELDARLFPQEAKP